MKIVKRLLTAACVMKHPYYYQFIATSYILNILKSEFHCNSRSKASCPLDNKWLTHNVIYGSDVQNDANDEKEFYLGVNQTPFKEHFRNPNNKCTNKKCENTTELLKCTWQLMDTNITPIVTWK